MAAPTLVCLMGLTGQLWAVKWAGTYSFPAFPPASQGRSSPCSLAHRTCQSGSLPAGLENCPRLAAGAQGANLSQSFPKPAWGVMQALGSPGSTERW